MAETFQKSKLKFQENDLKSFKLQELNKHNPQTSDITFVNLIKTKNREYGYLQLLHW